MLSILHIENIAVIELADITFDDKLNVLTGETGAGKSIIIDALGALLGARTSRDLIRTGAARALVSAVFFRPAPAVEPLLRELGLTLQEELQVSRELHPDGRNVCKIGGVPATVAQLRTLGELLVQIHGQHDTHSLLSDERHLGLLDSFAHTEPEPYTRAYDAWRAVEKEIKSLKMNEEDKARRIDTLEYRIGELEKAALRPGEEEELTEQRRVVKNLQRITEALELSYAALYGSDESSGAIELIDNASAELTGAAKYGEHFAELGTRLNEQRYLIEDVAVEIREKRFELEHSDWDVNSIEARLDVLYRLKSKYNAGIEELIELLPQWQQELEDISLADETLAKLGQKRAEAEQRVLVEADKLTQKRVKAAKQLEKRLVRELAELDMQRVRFQVEIEPTTPGVNGADTIRFLLAANPGEPLKPLSKTASGGELSRIMLAMKNVLSEGEDGITLVFDEVDTGVSGRAAQRVAEKLMQVASRKQVLCVTHLTQIAAMADTHFVITKAVKGERTVTTVEPLNREKRIEELARITGGSQITETLKLGAADLLVQAEDFKQAQG